MSNPNESNVVESRNVPFSAIESGVELADYPLSSAQQRLWFLSQMPEANVAYNIPNAFVFRGELNMHAFHAAFLKIMQRHDILRTTFHEADNGSIRQRINPLHETGFTIDVLDFRSRENLQSVLKNEVHREFMLPFDLERGPLIRVKAYRVEDAKWIVSYTIHHIIMDGWSLEIFIREIFSYYESILKGEDLQLPPLRIQYKDYALWEQRQLDQPAFQELKRYWIECFDGEIPTLQFASDKFRPIFKSYNGSVVFKNIDADLSQRLKKVGQKQGATFFMTLLSAVYALLYRYTGQTDLVIGCPIAGRSHIDFEQQLGLYANTLALRSRFSGTDTFESLLQIVRSVTLGAYKHQAYPFDDLVRDLKYTNDKSRNPLFDVIVLFQNGSFHDTHALQVKRGIQIDGFIDQIEYQVSKVDITFDFAESEHGLRLGIGYNTDLFFRDSIQRLADNFEQLIRSVVENTQSPISSLPYLPQHERECILNVFGQSQSFQHSEKTIVDLVDDRCRLHPETLALHAGDKRVTYGELMIVSGRCADYLHRNLTITPGDIVGIFMDRSADAICTMLAVLKTGGAFVSLDPANPISRNLYILRDTNAKAVIADAHYVESLTDFNGTIIPASYSVSEANTQSAFVSRAVATDLAYCIYTSGSTGQPKGVMIDHRAIANTIISQSLIFDLSGTQRVLQFSSFSFDASIWEIFMALAHGKTMCMINDEDKGNPEALEQFIRDHSVGIATLTPAIVQTLKVSRLSTLQILITAGEAANPDKLADLHPNTRYFNAYGPTESAICATIHESTRETSYNYSVPIGKPIPNTVIYILSDELELCGIGVPGEIFIAGPGLALGYLKDQLLTAQKFITNPFVPGQRMFRSGDCAKWLSNGEIEFLGRKDNQIKIRGNRIELKEIEARLHAHQDVKACVVQPVIDDAGEKTLVAYVLSEGGIQALALQHYLREHLPSYMIPNRILRIEKFPLLPSGKIDQRKLDEFLRSQISDEIQIVTPSNDTERKLMAVWKNILQKETISIKDSFFELGGHSLKATQLVNQISRTWNIKIPLKELFSNTTLEEQAALIDKFQWLQSDETFDNEITL